MANRTPSVTLKARVVASYAGKTLREPMGIETLVEHMFNAAAIELQLTFKSMMTGVASTAAREAETLGLTRVDIRQIIPDRTLERRIAAGENLKIDEADGLARLLRVVTMARQVFEDTALADEWLRSPNPALDGLIPIQMARTDLGGREVEAVLTRLAHGVF